MRIRSALILCLSWLPMLAGAEQIRPGLWEFTGNMQGDGQAMPDMQQMLDQLQSMPPEQRQMMEQMMAKQGVKLGSAGIQLCLSEEQAKARDVPLADPSSGCTHEITERGEDVMKFRFTCPDGRGEGETHFESDTAFSTQVKGVYSGRQSDMHSQARWLGADCGGLLPR